jgi:hypothetical protein
VDQYNIFADVYTVVRLTVAINKKKEDKLSIPEFCKIAEPLVFVSYKFSLEYNLFFFICVLCFIYTTFTVCRFWKWPTAKLTRNVYRTS